MSILNLTIDLPRSHYTVTDAPTATERVTNMLMALFSTVLLILAVIGGAIIYGAGYIGGLLEQTVDRLYHLTDTRISAGPWLSRWCQTLYHCRALTIIDGWMIILIATFIHAVLFRGTIYATA